MSRSDVAFGKPCS